MIMLQSIIAAPVFHPRVYGTARVTQGVWGYTLVQSLMSHSQLALSHQLPETLRYTVKSIMNCLLESSGTELYRCMTIPAAWLTINGYTCDMHSITDVALTEYIET